MSFEQRKNKASILEDKLKAYFDSIGVEYALTGYENFISTDNFKDKIRKATDNTAERIRFFPDFTIINKQVWLIEAKNSITIEKRAYDNYMGLSMMGYNVGIIFNKDGELLFANINDVVLKKAYGKMPIIDGVWLAPREMSDNEYFEWKAKHPKASGTTFGYIDFEKTKIIKL